MFLIFHQKLMLLDDASVGISSMKLNDITEYTEMFYFFSLIAWLLQLTYDQYPYVIDGNMSINHNNHFH